MRYVPMTVYIQYIYCIYTVIGMYNLILACYVPCAGHGQCFKNAYTHVQYTHTSGPWPSIKYTSQPPEADLLTSKLSS